MHPFSHHHHWFVELAESYNSQNFVSIITCYGFPTSYSYLVSKCRCLVDVMSSVHQWPSLRFTESSTFRSPMQQWMPSIASTTPLPFLLITRLPPETAPDLHLKHRNPTKIRSEIELWDHIKGSIQGNDGKWKCCNEVFSFSTMSFE